jgi:predicted nucleic acid-binding protein
VAAAKAGLSWGEVYETDTGTAAVAGEVSDEVGPQGLFLAGMDGLIAAVGWGLNALVVSNDRDLTHEETTNVVNVEAYRD